MALTVSGEFNNSMRPFMYVVQQTSQCQEFFGVDAEAFLRDDLSNIALPFCLTFGAVNPGGIAVRQPKEKA